jgi:membrane protein DedA with SNARE-associated domain
MAVFIAILVEGFGVPAPGQTMLMAGAFLAARGGVSITLVLYLRRNRKHRASAFF